jgi:hypothetical protein
MIVVATLRFEKDVGALRFLYVPLVGVGFLLNVLVIAANDGLMPVAAQWDEIPESSRDRCKPIDQGTRLRLLADWIPLGSLLISPGDVLVVVAGVAYVVGMSVG